jgi:hypothetical protein
MDGITAQGKHRLKGFLGLEEATQNDDDRVWH